MKIRWTAGSVRVRITPVELSQLQASRYVEEVLDYPGGGGWSVRLVPNQKERAAFGDRETLFIYLTAADLAALSDEAQEGVYFQNPDPPLRYYIEKDFPCAHPRPAEALERPTETFAPPPALAERKAQQN